MPARNEHQWFKSSHSGGNDSCVEVALPSDRAVLVRDSKSGGASPILRFPTAQWRTFVTAVREGEFAIATKM